MDIILECLRCEEDVDRRVYHYSNENFGETLCRDCQNWFRDILEYSSASDEAISLYFELLKFGVPAELEKCDGHKTIDIAVPIAKINIEVDGMHHNLSYKQALSDLKRTYHAFKKGYFTLRIPNSLIQNCLEEAAELVVEMIEINQRRINRRK